MSRRRFTRRQLGARKAMVTRARSMGELLKRTCGNCRHEVVKVKPIPMPDGTIYEIRTPLCGRTGTLVHTHEARGQYAPCGPMGQLWEAKEGKEGET